MEALKVWLTHRWIFPHLYLIEFQGDSTYNIAAKLTQCLNNSALRFNFVVTVVNIAEIYEIIVIQFRDNYKRRWNVYKMCKVWKSDGRTVLMCLQIMEQIKLRSRDNRIIIIDQNVILKSNCEGKNFKNRKFFWTAVLLSSFRAKLLIWFLFE
jgi:hypothetical protein